MIRSSGYIGSFEEKVRLLSRVDIFDMLSRDELELLARRGNDIALDEGEIWFAPVRSKGPLFVLLRGKVLLYEVVRAREFTFMVAGSGTLFGEMSLYEQPPRSTYAQALEPSWLCPVSHHTLEYIMKNRPEVSIGMAELLAERLSF